MTDYLQWAAIGLLLLLRIGDGHRIRKLEGAGKIVDAAIERLFEGLIKTNKASASLADSVTGVVAALKTALRSVEKEGG